MVPHVPLKFDYLFNRKRKPSLSFVPVLIVTLESLPPAGNLILSYEWYFFFDLVFLDKLIKIQEIIYIVKQIR